MGQQIRSIKHFEFRWDDPMWEHNARHIHTEVYEKQGSERFPDGLCVIFRTMTHVHLTYTQLHEYINVLKHLAEGMKKS